VKEACLYKKLKTKQRAPHRAEDSDAWVQCTNCAHYCLIKNAHRGICGVRENKDGKLYSLVYSKAIAINIDPIEKKPFFHFLPGSYSLSMATVGCNFSCLYCQNYDISQDPKSNKPISFFYNLSPQEIVEMALKNKTPSISYTYTEPTIFLEYALDTMKLAKKAGLKNNWVTNGFMSKEALDLVAPYLDAANVDLKGFNEEFYQKVCGGRLQPVLETLKRMKTLRRRSGQGKIWAEVTTLVIPTLNDDEKTFKDIAKFIYEELGPETPWHISQFCGAISWKLQHIPDTPIETLEKAYQIGKEAGLKYVYTGNVPGHRGEDTFCPQCGTLCIDRTNYIIHRYDKDGKCPKCGEDLDLIL